MRNKMAAPDLVGAWHNRFLLSQRLRKSFTFQVIAPLQSALHGEVGRCHFIAK